MQKTRILTRNAEWELVPECWLQLAEGIRRQAVARSDSALPT